MTLGVESSGTSVLAIGGGMPGVKPGGGMPGGGARPGGGKPGGGPINGRTTGIMGGGPGGT